MVIQSTDVEDLTLRLVLVEVHALVRILAHAKNGAYFHSEFSVLVGGSVFGLLCFFFVTLRAGNSLLQGLLAIDLEHLLLNVHSLL